MLTAILIDPESQALQALDKQIQTYCPHVKIKEKACSMESIVHTLEQDCPDLVFVDIQNPAGEEIATLAKLSYLKCAVIVVTQVQQYALEAFKYGVSGYILKPVIPGDLQRTVQNVQKIFSLQAGKKACTPKVGVSKISMQTHQRIGVPNLKGYDFIPVMEIIRCEGLQKCTRIVTRTRSNMVSSYNLGEFRKLLEPYGFFLSHKSHLINLSYVKQYFREGIIMLCDDSSVPVSRRKRNEFLALLPHL